MDRPDCRQPYGTLHGTWCAPLSFLSQRWQTILGNWERFGWRFDDWCESRIWEASQLNVLTTVTGILAGGLLMLIARYSLPAGSHDAEDILESSNKSGFRKMLLIMFVMTVHSFAEGIGVGVAYGGREGFGNLITAAIAIHNIPEGLAIGLVMIPRGVSILKAGGWSVLSSLPQPIMAVPAFLFVTAFAPWLPFGLGLAAGAMFYMVAFELAPEAIESTSRKTVAAFFLPATVAMLAFQFLMQ